MKLIAMTLFFWGISAQSATQKITYFQLSDSKPEFVLKQNPNSRISHSYLKLTKDQAANLKDKNNIWVWIEPSCQLQQDAKYDEEGVCAPQMLHYSEYLRALNSKAL